MRKCLPLGLLLALLLCLATAGCHTPMNKDAYVQDFTEFVEKVEADGADYSLRDWEQADERYEDFTDDYYERFADKLSPEDQKTLGRNVARYTKIRMAYALQGLSDDIEDGTNFMKGFLEESNDELDAPVDQLMQEMNELDEADWDID